MKQIDAEWLHDPRVQIIFKTLGKAGHQAYFVGGCVRNAILGADISDIDIATDALPQNVMKLAKKERLRVISTGIEHGTVTVVSHGLTCEITTFRKDTETDGRHALVEFSGSMHEDARRRDFTMNALYADQNGQIIDPLNGLTDVVNRQVRFIENPVQRIQEDYLRILRFFRFHAWYGDSDAGIDPDGLAAIGGQLGGLDTVSRERIGAELLKTLAAPNPSPAIGGMQQVGVLRHVLPGADAQFLPVLVHFENQIGAAPDAIRRLASLGDVTDIQEKMRLSRRDTKKLRALVSEIGTMTGTAELAYRNTCQFAIDVALLRSAILTSPLPQDLNAQARLGASAVFPLRASDLAETVQGATLGKRLRVLEQEWILSDFTLSRKELLS